MLDRAPQLASTHHGELMTLKYSDGTVFENACMDFDPNKLAPTYQVLWGLPGRSHAVEIATKLGLDEVTAEMTQELLGSSGSTVNEMIVKLEVTRREEVEALRKNAEIERECQRLERELNAIKNQNDEVVADAWRTLDSEVRTYAGNAKTRLNATLRTSSRGKVGFNLSFVGI